MAIVRSESLARRVGGWLDWLARTSGRCPQDAAGHIVENVLDLRERSKDILTQHGLLAFGGRGRGEARLVPRPRGLAVGRRRDPDVLPPSAVLAAMAVVGIIALIPITPGAVGVTEVAYIGVLTSVAGRA